jgi:tetratricopeptide (TPR) repeat protein
MADSPLRIKHYSFISGVINEILSIEKELITSDGEKFNDFICPALFDQQYNVRFMIERYLYLTAYIKFSKINLDHGEMDDYVNSISMEEYKLSSSESKCFIKNRIDFYFRELEILSKAKYPYAGILIRSLYNPSNKDVSGDFNSMLEKNFVAGMYLLGIINKTFKNEFNCYINSDDGKSTSKDNKSEALSFYQTGINFEKSGEYEEALDNFFKAKSLDKTLQGLSAHILISRFWTGEFEIEDEYESLFDSFSIEIKNNPKIIELFESRAWLCYHILNNVENLNETKYMFYKSQSESDFSVCISSDPNNTKFYGSRSLLFRHTKEFSKALQDINKAIDLAPEYSRHYKDRADIFKSIGKLKDSLIDIETAISLCKEERWSQEYKKLKESIIISIRESITKKEIKSHFESISNSTQLQPGAIIIMYERDLTKGNTVIEYQISKINQNIITVQKMAINGEPLKVKQRVVTTFKFEDFVNNKSSILIDETNDKDDWPKTLPDAIKQLLEIYDEAELNSISQMSWSEFQMKYFTYGGVDQWLRNNFGLWRGNYDLLLDSKIDKIDADNASISILYHFWEYVVDIIRPKK